MLKAGIYGASGYTGQELLKILVNHPEVEIAAVTSRRFNGMRIPDVYPCFEGLTEQRFRDSSPDEFAPLCDVIFSALPHGVAMDFVPKLLKSGKKVIDLSADFRLRELSVYEKWYRGHSSPELLATAVYGLPELYREEIKSAALVANPGCYPTSIILGLAPLLRSGLAELESIIVDSKSGVSGAGREPKIGSLFCEVNEGFKAYGVLVHRHTPEIEQELSALARTEVKITFVPHLLPVNRGILSTIYATMKHEVSAASLLDMYSEFYKNEAFVQVLKSGTYPNISSVKGTNNCQIGINADPARRRIVVVSVIDNLFKGAAGQAIQNMNLMCGLEEGVGLKNVALFP